MTDEKIIKALECCSTKGVSCKDCPAFVKVDRSNCRQVLTGATDIINRQKAEIERLSEDLKIQNKYWLYYWKDVFEVGMEKLKAGAIKDFADDLMAKAYLSSNWSNSERTYVVEVKDIDNLVKEMIGEQ
jgi:hypothetical protein